MNLGDNVSDFEADSTAGKLKLHDYLGHHWGVIFALPRDFHAVATTELAELAKRASEFNRRNVRLAVVSGDNVDTHQTWLKDVMAYEPSLKDLPFPIVADETKAIAKQLKILEESNSTGAVLIVGADKKLKLAMLYPSSTGRNIDEVIRVIDSLQLTHTRQLATPSQWKYGGHNCLLHDETSEADAAKLFPHGVKTLDLPSGKPYFRTTVDPRVERVQLPSWFVAEEYDMTLHPNVNPESTFRFEGSQSLTCHISLAHQRRVTLHAKELSMLSSSFQAGDFTTEAVAFDYDLEECTVTITFKESLPVGRGVLKSEFIGTHNNQMAGFYRSGYTDAEKRQKVMVSTQFEALDARRCFPCVDEPQAKAIFKATLVVDAHLTALSNMPEAETTILPGGKKKRVAFLPSPKMSTYLLAFAVGEFDYLSKLTEHGVLVRVFTPPTKSSQGKFALDVACKSLDLYDDFFGVPYPLPKLDMIAIPEFAMGAMENWGLVTYREVEVLIAEGASADQKQRVCTVITHELAHQWFGNLITMAWWDGLWLNEGFASWMQTFAADVVFPEWEIWTSFVVDDQAAALSADALTSSHPIQVPIRRAEEVEEVFDAISYHKGACVVQLIRAYLGPDVFRAGLQLYMQRHAYGNTETVDLWKAWEDASGGKPVLKVMASWTEQMGFPVLSVSKIKSEGSKFSFKVKQSWFLADGSRPAGWETKVWSIPLLASYQSLGSDEVSVVGVDVGLYDSRGEATFEIVTNQEISSKKTWVKLNAGQHVPMRVLYEDQSDIENLAAAVREKALKSEDRAGLLLDAYALAKAGLQSPGQVLILLRAYENEDNMAVWDAIEQVLGGLSTLLRGEDKLNEQFTKFAARLIKKQAERLGWEDKPGEGHLDNLSRSILVRLQCKFAPEDVKAKASELLKAYLATPTDPKALNSNIKTPVLRVALANGTRKDMEDTKNTLEVLDTVAEKKDVYAALGFTPKVEDKEAVLDWCTSGAVKLQDFFYPMASVSGSGKQGAELAFDYMKRHFDRIHNMIKKGSPSLIMAVISYCCSGFASKERAEEIDNFFKANPVPLAARRVAQIVENTKANAAFLNRMKSDGVFQDLIVT